MLSRVDRFRQAISNRVGTVSLLNVTGVHVNEPGAGRRTNTDELRKKGLVAESVLNRGDAALAARGFILPQASMRTVVDSEHRTATAKKRQAMWLKNFANFAILMPHYVNYALRADREVGPLNSDQGFLRQILRDRPEAATLDAAASFGATSRALVERGVVLPHDLTANEPDPHLYKLLQEISTQYRFTCNQLQWNELWWSDRSFGAIVCTGNALSHAFGPDVKESLAHFFRMLVHGGKLVIDERNFAAILEDPARFKPTGGHLFFGTDKVGIAPIFVDPELVIMELGPNHRRIARPTDSFGVEGSSNGHGALPAAFICMNPFPPGHLQQLLEEVGFVVIRKYHDGQPKKPARHDNTAPGPGVQFISYECVKP